MLVAVHPWGKTPCAVRGMLAPSDILVGKALPHSTHAMSEDHLDTEIQVPHCLHRARTILVQMA